MATQYVGRAPLPYYLPQNPDDVYNGLKCSGSVVLRMADNQTWLATQDIPAGNFLTNQRAAATRTANKIQFKIRMPPFTTHVEFWFWTVFNFDNATTNAPYVKVYCTDTASTRKHYGATGGSDTPLGKGTGSAGISQQAHWIAFQGDDPGDLTTPDDFALAVEARTTADNAWGTANFEVSCVADSDAAAPIILSGYYRVVAPRQALASQS